MAVIVDLACSGALALVIAVAVDSTGARSISERALEMKVDN